MLNSSPTILLEEHAKVSAKFLKTNKAKFHKYTWCYILKIITKDYLFQAIIIFSFIQIVLIDLCAFRRIGGITKTPSRKINILYD